MAVGGALEVGGAGPHKGARDHTAHRMGAGEHPAGDLAVAVQLLHRHNGLVGRDLEYAVGAGVDDQSAGAQMLLAVVADDVGAGVGQVADDLAPGETLKFFDHLGRESVRIGGQRLGAHHTGDLPVADGGVLAAAALLQTAKRAQRCRRRIAGRFGDVEHSQRRQGGRVKIGVAGTRAQCVGTFIGKIGGVGRMAHAKAVQNDQKHTFDHMRSSFCFIIG